MLHDVAIPIQQTFSHRPRPYAHGRGPLQWGYQITVDQPETVLCNILASLIFVEGLKVTSCCKCPSGITLRFRSPVLKFGLWTSRHPDSAQLKVHWRWGSSDTLGVFAKAFAKKSSTTWWRSLWIAWISLWFIEAYWIIDVWKSKGAKGAQIVPLTHDSY